VASNGECLRENLPQTGVARERDLAPLWTMFFVLLEWGNMCTKKALENLENEREKEHVPSLTSQARIILGYLGRLRSRAIFLLQSGCEQDEFLSQVAKLVRLSDSAMVHIDGSSPREHASLLEAVKRIEEELSGALEAARAFVPLPQQGRS